MITLALEFSSPIRSVAVLDSEPGRGSGSVLGQASDEGCRTAQPLQLIERALTQARVEREGVDCLALGLGPGSYTGIRSAIALAQGWQLARAVRLTGIGTVECLAAQAHAQQWFGQVHVLIDAQRNEFYEAGFYIEASGWRETGPLRLATMQEVSALIRPDQAGRDSEGAKEMICIGPEVTRWFAEGRLLFPDATVTAQLALGQTDFVPGEKLEPIYLRQTSFVKAPPPRTIAPLKARSTR